jgi:hypothetical protein
MNIYTTKEMKLYIEKIDSVLSEASKSPVAYIESLLEKEKNVTN